MTRFYSMGHVNPATMDGYDTDAQRDWLLALPDAELADYARYRVPDNLLATVARAYFTAHPEPRALDGILADSLADYEDAAQRSKDL